MLILMTIGALAFEKPLYSFDALSKAAKVMQAHLTFCIARAGDKEVTNNLLFQALTVLQHLNSLPSN